MRASLQLRSVLRPLSVVLACLTCISGLSNAQPKYRRGNPTPNFSRSEFYVIDSDDESPQKPTYKFLDTSFGTWVRVTGFSNNDDGWARVSNTVDSILMPYYIVNTYVLQPPVSDGSGHMTAGSSISTNGTICLYGLDSSAANQQLPIIGNGADLVAPLWADWELIPSGANRTNIYVRPVSPDSFYVSFYNLGLKGTSGQIRATFQTVFCRADTSITFEYKSFDGVLNGIPAAQIIQQVATIGLMHRFLDLGVTYLNKGYYYATSTTGHAQNLHNSLAVKFLRQNNDAFQIDNITFPPYDRYELTSNTIVPTCTVENPSDSTTRIFVNTNMTNLTTGVVFYAKHDSIDIGAQNNGTYTGPAYPGLPTGSYKVTFTLSYRNGVSDQWTDNNTLTRYFVYLGSASVPFREEFNSGLSASLWSNVGADVRTAASIMYLPPPTLAGVAKALVLNRLDANGLTYNADIGGDTLTSAPMDLSTTAKAYVYFHYQRGLSTDNSQAGIYSRLHSGPELPIPYAQGGMAQQGDTLLIEGLVSGGSRWNPAEASWSQLGVIPGGFDATTQTFRVLLGSQFLHDHFRLRFRVLSRNALVAKSPATPQFFQEDADNFVIDGLHVEPFVTHKTELEPMDVDLGNGIYNHVPRNVSDGLTPKVRVLNNGDDVLLGLFIAHLRVWDGLGRIVYDRTQQCDIPPSLTDQQFAMPAWDIRGSQGGVFTALVTLQSTDYDTYHANDTNIYYKTLAIDDQYSIDDGQPDSLATATTAPSNFYYNFTPLGNDTLKGARFYYTGSSATSSWSLDIFANGTTVNRSFSVSPSGAGWYMANFAPVALKDTTNYRLHFVMSTGSNFGGDGTNGLVFYTQIDTTNSANNRYSTLHPEILSQFQYSPTTAYTSPTASDAAAGGFLLPMFRLVFSGSSTYLPVELASISARRDANGGVILTWRTAMEDKVATYEIERVATHEIVAQVAARNISSGAEYATLDRTAPKDAVMYELFSRDQDGTRASLGHVLAGPFGAATGLTISAYPNPSHGTLSVVSSEPLGSLLLIDPLGRVVKRFGAVNGNQSFDVTNLSDGSYFLAGSSETESVRIPVTIIH